MLNDQNTYSEIDLANMLDDLVQYPQQIKKGVEIAEGTEIERFLKIDNIIITGMGGSAISGDIVSHLFRDRLEIPIIVNREYDLPKWANKDTLTIFISYSGNTEETLSSFKIASQKKCKIICISSGGKLQEMCEIRGIHHILIPSGFQPRAATMLILFPLIIILKKTGLIKYDLQSDIEETIDIAQDFVDKNKKSIPTENNLSKQLAEKIYGTIPQIYGWGFYIPIAIRWRQQFNENSKLIARSDSVSESNHNDIVGWSANSEISKKFSCIIFRDKTEESIYMSTRLNFMKTLFDDTSAGVFEIHSKGKSRLAKMMYIMYLGDFTSCYIAILRKIDPSPVDIIMELKKRLSEL
jgi:glucose/mannose-6-phosphate isomerase